jgi:seryl-tRNA synthetase
MLDIKLLRETPELIRADLNKRGRDTAIIEELLAADVSWREGTQQLNDLRAQRNTAAKAISEAKKSGGDVAAAVAGMKQVADDIKALDASVAAAVAARDGILRSLPNLMHESVPVGADDTENVLVRAWGGQPKHDFPAVSHVDLLTSLDLADLERAARAAGSRFVYMKGDLVMLGRALEFFALQFLRGKGYTPIEPPYMLRREAIEGAVDLSDFEDVIYRVDAGTAATGDDGKPLKGESPELFLIATSEHPLAAMHMGEIIEHEQLPVKYAGVSPCFRKEAGAHGKDTKGIFRVHQFSKVEQFVYCEPEDSWTIHEEMIGNAEALYKALEIPYRVVNICTGDLGTVAAKKLDIEAWMPVQQAYREVVSGSNCTDYQARRYNTRTRDAPGEPTRFLHTLNSTAIAVQRTLVAILENHQQSDGSVRIPKVLQPLVGAESIQAT